MKFPTRSRTAPSTAGLVGPARVDRRVRTLLPRLRAGDVVLIDAIDLDRNTALALIDAKVAAVVNASAFLSGRYPALGPQLLGDAGVLMVDQAGPEAMARVRDGAEVRLHDGTLHLGDEAVATGRVATPELLAHDMQAARRGLTSQLETFTHNSSELLRREPDLLLHGQGLPPLDLGDTPALVVVPSHDAARELRTIRDWVRDVRPVLIGVDQGADVMLRAGHKPRVVVVDADAGDDSLPSTKALRSAREVVVRTGPGSGSLAVERVERLGVRPRVVETSLTTEDVGLLLAAVSETPLIVGVGMHATLDDFLDRQQGGVASTWLTRLRVGQRLVDATAVPALYSGRLRPRHLLLAILVGLVALLAALLTTPVGQERWDELAPHLADWYEQVNTWVRGVLP